MPRNGFKWFPRSRRSGVQSDTRNHARSCAMVLGHFTKGHSALRGGRLATLLLPGKADALEALQRALFPRAGDGEGDAGGLDVGEEPFAVGAEGRPAPF